MTIQSIEDLYSLTPEDPAAVALTSYARRVISWEASSVHNLTWLGLNPEVWFIHTTEKKSLRLHRSIGVGQSTPRVSFFKTAAERALWPDLRDQVVTNSSLPLFLARAKLTGQLAKETDDGYLKHINTDQTARDMLLIVEAHGREKP